MRLARNNCGFTLAELLIVVFIIGLVSTIIVLRFRAPTHEATPQTYSQDMLRYFQIVQEQAIIKPGILGVKFKDRQYQVFHLKSINNVKKWIPLSDQSQFWEPRVIPKTINIDLQLKESSRNFASILADDRPDIVFLPSGEVTPFVLYLIEDDGSKRYTVRGDESGNLAIGTT